MSRKEEDYERLEAELATTRNEVRFMASTEKGKLRAVNAKLLEALEWFSNRFHTNAEVAKQWAGSCSMSAAEWQDWEVRAHAVIEEARK